MSVRSRLGLYGSDLSGVSGVCAKAAAAAKRKKQDSRMRFTEGLRVTLSAEARPHAICHNLPPDQTCLRIHALSFAHVCSASPGCTCRQYTFAAVRGYETGPREDYLSQEGDYPPRWIPGPQARFSVQSRAACVSA